MNVQQLRADYLINRLAEHFSSSSFDIGLYYSYIFSLTLITLSLTVILFVIRKVLLIRSILKKDSIILELTPPASTEKTAYTTQQFFSVIHHLGSKRSFLDKLLGKKKIFSFEIVSSMNQGIRYLIRTTPDAANNIKRYLISYLPYVAIKAVNDYWSEKIEKGNNLFSKVVEFKQKLNFAYPLQKQDILVEHDPVAYITGMMTKLTPDELISFQLVLAPTRSKETYVIKRKILTGEDVFVYLDRFNLPQSFQIFQIPLVIAVKLIGSVISTVDWCAQTFFNDLNGVRIPSWKLQEQNDQKRQPKIFNTFEQEAIKSIEEKVDQQLFETRIRLLVTLDNRTDLAERIGGFGSSLAIFNTPGYQSLERMSNFSCRIFSKLQLIRFRERVLSLTSNTSPNLLSVSEISDLYHIPFTRVTKTENIVKVHSKELPTPLSLKNQNNLDVCFAKNSYAGSITMIGLTEEERRRHVYCLGATGSGKSTLIYSMASQDIKNGKGVCVIDPHGDLAKNLLTSIPKERANDLIYFNPFDVKHPIGLNLMETTPGLDEDEALLEQEFLAESIISLFRKVFSDAMVGHPHRIEYILRNTIHTAFTTDKPTMFTIYDLLNNPPFQEKVVTELDDKRLINFWKYEFGKAGDYQKVKMVSPITARIGRFLFSTTAKRILEQKKSTIDFDEILNMGKILICNLAKGNLGDDTSQILGMTILNKIQISALKRARAESESRRDFYLYVDEFQNFATRSFVEMLSESRKYNLNITIAEQSTSQVRDRSLVNIILANVGSVISFKSANPDDEKLLLPQFYPYITQGEIYNLPSFHFYMKISAMHPEEPFSGETIQHNVQIDREWVDSLIENSRDKYAIIYKKPKLKIITTKVKSAPKEGHNPMDIGVLS